MSEQKKVEVSVLMLAYNHEKYIEQAIESILLQNTSFNYELLIHDDASTDKTRDVIRKYQEQYPDVIRVILQEENQFSKHVSISKEFFVPMIRGKYVALCEGDDYWTDNYKLQKQYDALENNSSCSMCVNRVKVKFNDSKLDHFSYKYSDRDCVIRSEELFDLLNRCNYPFQTSGYFIRADLYIRYQNNKPEFALRSDVGDEPLLFYMGANGDIYYCSDVMSCYRKNVSTSWSATFGADKKNRAEHYRKMISMCEAFEDYCDHKYNMNDRIVAHQKFIYVLDSDYKSAYRLINKNRKLYPIRTRFSYFVRAYFPLIHKMIRKIVGVNNE